jgi:hypothetical protein
MCRYVDTCRYGVEEEGDMCRYGVEEEGDMCRYVSIWVNMCQYVSMSVWRGGIRGFVSTCRYVSIVLLKNVCARVHVFKRLFV